MCLSCPARQFPKVRAGSVLFTSMEPSMSRMTSTHPVKELLSGNSGLESRRRSTWSGLGGWGPGPGTQPSGKPLTTQDGGQQGAGWWLSCCPGLPGTCGSTPRDMGPVRQLHLQGLCGNGSPSSGSLTGCGCGLTQRAGRRRGGRGAHSHAFPVLGLGWGRRRGKQETGR